MCVTQAINLKPDRGLRDGHKNNDSCCHGTQAKHHTFAPSRLQALKGTWHKSVSYVALSATFVHKP